ncbi:MAG: tyrosine--tRNA ligase [Anaerolineaceae bacterium]|jgi:tyrosyl-tRNA synthetase|nr:tyrosine--tRNA ligase [Anaerolineaceae bacterium]
MTIINNAFDELKWRGMIFDYVEGIDSILGEKKVTVYNGFDATADSLHVGHMVPLLALARLQRFGHHAIALAGGGTSMIGDPSGKASERQLLSQQIIEENVEAIKQQLSHFLDFKVKSNPARVLNNASWLMKLDLIEFLRDIGKHFTINYMLAKDSVRSRIDREEGISYTEFSYMLLQSYDFLYLHQNENCILQTGGSDQWGNITAGGELVRRITGHSVYGMVYPLITKSDGSKFGKTESGSVWLNPERTSPFKFYQFWLNTDDKDVINYLKYFTFLSKDVIDELALSVADKPEAREAQKKLAKEITTIVHGETALSRAEQATQVLFGGSLEGLTGSDIEEIFSDVQSTQLSRSDFEGEGKSIIDLLVDCGIAKSKGEARRSIQEGGINLNNNRVSEVDYLTRLDALIDNRYIILRKGRKHYHLVKVL